MRTATSLLAAAVALALAASACTSSSSDEPGEATVVTTTLATGGSTTTTTAEPGEDGGEPASYAGTDPAPEFPEGLDWLNTGRPLSLAELRGKIVLLDFWTYGCINCIHIIPDLERLEQEFPDELAVIGVHSAKFDQEGETGNIRQVVLRYGLEHPVVNDRDFEVWRTWGARAWPTVALVDPAGNIVGAHSGEGVYPVVAPVIASLVAEFDERGTLDRTPIDLDLEGAGLPQTLLSFPGKVHADPERDRLFVADTNHHRIVAARISDGEVLAVYGTGRRGYEDGTATAAFSSPQGLALDPQAGTLYVADTGNHTVRAVDLATGRVTTIAGTGSQGLYPPAGGIATVVGLRSPWDLALDGDRLYVAMAGSHQIWVVGLATGLAEPFAGNGRESTRNGPRREAELAQPSGLAGDGAGRLYFADAESSSIRWVDTADDGEVGVLVGSDEGLFDFGDRDGAGTEARLQHPLGVAWHEGLLYVADTYNSKVKVVDPVTREITTLFGGEAGWRDGADPLFYEPGGIHAADGVLYVADTNNHSIRLVDLATGEASTLLLKGMERFAPPPGSEDYEGTLVVMPPAAVGAGEGTLILDITLPPGYKVNDEAPSAVAWEAAGTVRPGPGADRSLTGATFPVVVPARFEPGTGTVTADVDLIWCAADATSLCFIEQVRITAPVEVGGEGGSEVRLAHTITATGLER